MAGLSRRHAALKRSLDLLVSTLGLIAFGWLIVLAALAATIDTGKNGFFTQVRVGRNGRRFRIVKLRTMREVPSITTTVTADGDARITRLGRLLRKLKLDELPQLINVFIGQMSLVGPRPDVPELTDTITGDDRIILTVRPGITGPATLKYRNEESLLARQGDPEAYNADVIFPDKVRINADYVRNWSLRGDLRYLLLTVTGASGDGL